jgi:chromosome segregation ATPase
MVTEKEQEKNEGVDSDGGENENVEEANGALEEQVSSLKATVLRLEQGLAEKDGEIAGLTQELSEARQAVDELHQAVAQAVAAYKETVVLTNPGLLPDMITGDSIEEIDESVKKARAVIEKVRQEMEAEAARTKIPAGAPPRSRPDFSALSPREKIKYAMEGG